MAGASWVAAIAQQVIDKRAEPDCVPVYTAITTCVGNCHSATYLATQTNCPNSTQTPTTATVDCSDSMPCACSLGDFPGILSSPGVYTCGDCSEVAEGESCFFVCGFGEFTDNSIRSLMCLKSGWAEVDPSQYPTCSARVETCPPITANGGLIPEVSNQSTCVGAIVGDVCKGVCGPLFSSPYGWYDTTCTKNASGTLEWSRPLECAVQCCGGFDSLVCPEYPDPVNRYSAEYQ